MGRHIIKIKDFEAPYLIYHEMACSCGGESHKSLTAKINLSNNNVIYMVKNHNKIVFETPIFGGAIDFYNEIE